MKRKGIIGDSHQIKSCLDLAAKAAGASKVFVMEISETRGERLRNMGADEVINPNKTNAIDRIKRLTSGLGVDISFDCVGNAVSGPLALMGHRIELPAHMQRVALDPDEPDHRHQ